MTSPQLYTAAEARQLRYPQRVIAAIKIDRYLKDEFRLYIGWDTSATEYQITNKPYWEIEYAQFRKQQSFEALEAAALSRYHLTHDENSCVGYIHEGRLLLWADELEESKRFEATSYAVNQEVIG